MHADSIDSMRPVMRVRDPHPSHARAIDRGLITMRYQIFWSLSLSLPPGCDRVAL